MLTRTSLQALLDVDQPLRKIWELEYKDPEIEISKIFKVENMNGAEEKDMTTFGVGELEDVGEGGAVPYGDPGLGGSGGGPDRVSRARHGSRSRAHRRVGASGTARRSG